jgi:hypothetical protein
MSKERVIPFKVDYYDITGNHLSALVLVQLEYWQPKAFNGWISKKEEEWKQELRITYKMLQRIQDNLIELGFIDVKQAMYNGRKTTHYRVNSAAITNAIQALKDKSELTKGKLDERSTSPKVNITKGELIDLLKVNSSIDQRSVLYTESTTESTTENKKDENLTETSSVFPRLMNNDFMQQALEASVVKNQSAPSKPKKVKEPTDELTAEIHKYSNLSYEFFKEWYEKNHDTVLLDRDIDFINLKKTFRKLIKNSALKDEGKRFTPEKCYNGVKYIIENFSLLGSYHRNNISLNHIATNWNVIINEIKDKKNKPTNNSQGQPVQAIKTEPVNPDTTRERYMGRLLPYGTTYPSYSDLARAIFNHKKETEGYQTNLSISQWKWDVLYPEIKDYSLEQINQLKKKYNV